MKNYKKQLIKLLPYLLSLIGILSLGIGIWLLYISYNLPNPENFSSRIINQSTKIFARDQKTILYEIHGEEKRTIVGFEEIPDSIKKATLAAEDAEFYQHPAYDLKGIFRGVIINPLFRGTNVQGGSTITQQLVKNTLLTPERSITRKIKELLLAIKLEKRYTKDQIFGFYLNQIPYGSNAYGIESAAKTFFNKSAKEVSLAEAALLASLPKAPSFYSPYGNHFDKLKERQEYVLSRMKDFGWITEQDFEEAKKESLSFSKQKFPIKAPHFVFYIKSILEELYDSQLIETGGLNVYTTLDWDLQQIAEKAVFDGAEKNDKTWKADNATLVAQNPKTGEILAMVGSRDYFNLEKEGNLNISLMTRQPGSSFKPFVYLKAFEKGFTPETILFDVPTEFNASCSADPEQNKQTECYHPSNYDNKFRGPINLRKSLAQSLNIPAVKLLYLAGPEDVLKTAREFGIVTLAEKPEFYGLSLVLGGGGVRLIDMVQAYSILANEGLKNQQFAIEKITDSQNNLLYEHKSESTQIIDAKYIKILNNILSDDASRFPSYQLNGPLTIPGYQVAAKTGTSQDYRDAWTFGFTPTLAAGVWVGRNDYTPMDKNAAGGFAAAPIWNEFMKKALEKFPKESFSEPEKVLIDKPMLDGQYVVQTETGPQIHNILHWLDKNNPTGPIPTNPAIDSQYNNWEFGVQNWLIKNQSEISLPVSIVSGINLIDPKETDLAKVGESLKISFKINTNSKILRTELYFNNKPIIVFEANDQNLYSVLFSPSQVYENNQIMIKAYAENGQVLELTKEIKGIVL